MLDVDLISSVPTLEAPPRAAWASRCTCSCPISTWQTITESPRPSLPMRTNPFGWKADGVALAAAAQDARLRDAIRGESRRRWPRPRRAGCRREIGNPCSPSLPGRGRLRSGLLDGPRGLREIGARSGRCSRTSAWSMSVSVGTRMLGQQARRPYHGSLTGLAVAALDHFESSHACCSPALPASVPPMASIVVMACADRGTHPASRRLAWEMPSRLHGAGAAEGDAAAELGPVHMPSRLSAQDPQQRHVRLRVGPCCDLP